MKPLAIHCSVAPFSACAALISVTALVGWTFDWDSMKGVAPGFIPMNPLTATSLLAASVSLWLRREAMTGSRARNIGALLGALVAAAGGVRLADYLFDLPLEIDHVLFAASLGDSRMAPNTALCLLVVGLGLVTLDYVTRRGFWLAQVFALTVAIISTACLVGYAYGAQSLYQVSSFIPMALNTAVGLLCVSLGMLFVHARRGVPGLLLSTSQGGKLARMLGPVAIGIPFLVGWARIAGEEAGWYDARFGTAITVTTMMTLLMAAVSLAAASLNRTDAARREAADRLAQANVELESRIHERTAELADANAELVKKSDALQAVNRDLEQRSAEASQANCQLARQAAELAATNADLVQKNDENEMFVYSVSHDLRSPLVNLQGFSNELKATLSELQEVLEKAQTPPAEERRRQILGEDMPQSIHFIQTAVTRLSGIIDALLRLSRAGRVEYQPQVVDVTAMTQRVIESMSGTIFDRGAEITVDALPTVYGDPTAVEQVFANLIGNAVNYLDPGRPGKITVGSRPSAQPAGDGSEWTTYFVTDNGMGIPEAYHAKVFQALKRLHPNAAKGEGIGLAVVRRIVERHGGTAWFESSPGVGSTFYVNLPCSASGVRSIDGDAPRNPIRREVHAK